MAAPRELQEAHNALAAYDELPKWDGLNVYRGSGVGVFAGDKVIHMAPPADQVHRLMGDLLAWLPVERLVHQHQDAYYAAIAASTKQTDCAPFIGFMLGCIQNVVAKTLAVSEKTSEKTPQKLSGMILALGK